MDGGLGHGRVIYGKSKVTEEESKEIDNYKDRLANEHGIEVIRIDCFYNNNNKSDYIKNNILHSKLISILNLNSVNWVQVEKYALSNKVLEACKLKKENTNMTTFEIADIMRLNYQTITKYLKQGTNLGWCDYDPKEEQIKSGIKNGGKGKKPVEIFKDGELLGKFKSCYDLERQSEKLFDTKLDNRNISAVCSGKYPCKTYKDTYLNT